MGETFQRKPSILHATRYNDRAGTNALPILENRAKGAISCSLQRGDPARHRKSGAELHSLHFATPQEVRARDAGWEPHVVLDPARGSGLTSQSNILDDQCAQALGASVNGCRDTCRSATDNQHIEMLIAAEVDVESEEPRDLIRRLIGDRPLAAEYDGRNTGIDCAT